ncbi:hypothetical protein ZORO111903_13990 [Zobellia roscoffensis]|uniref:hypothetical protein n=1 Tax=Zobellia roscoffensis TaxID=2779508 RepID=UPI00188C05FC|nr:hypothetical protein [Zobellia roscoffensis]
MNIKVLPPNKCTEKELDLFHDLVLKGKQVDKNGLKNRISNSSVLGFCYIENSLVSISSIKRPNEGYKNRIFAKAKILELAKYHPFELGYAYTEKDFRGKGLNFRINERLLEFSVLEPIYATTHNVKMKGSLLRMGFKVVGAEYKGDSGHNIEILSHDLLKKINDGVSGFIDLKDTPS